MRPLRDHSPEDAEGFERLYDRFDAFGKAFLPIYGMPLPSAEAVWDLVRPRGRRGSTSSRTSPRSSSAPPVSSATLTSQRPR